MPPWVGIGMEGAIIDSLVVVAAMLRSSCLAGRGGEVTSQRGRLSMFYGGVTRQVGCGESGERILHELARGEVCVCVWARVCLEDDDIYRGWWQVGAGFGRDRDDEGLAADLYI